MTDIDWRKVIERLSAEAEADEQAAEAIVKRARSRTMLLGALITHLDREPGDPSDAERRRVYESMRRVDDEIEAGYRVPDLGQLAFEVEDCTVTLRNEEWVSILSALELVRGGSARLDADTAEMVQERIVGQLLRSDGAGE